MTKVELILQGISDGDTIGGPLAMASLVAEVLANDPYDFESLDKAYRHYYESGSFDSGPTFAKVHELVANGSTRAEAVVATHKLFKGSTVGSNPMHRFMVAAGLDIPYEHLDTLAKKDAKMTHYDPLSGLCSSVLVRILSRCLRVQNLNIATKSVFEELSATDRNILSVKSGTGGYAPEVLVSALHFAAQRIPGIANSIAFAGQNNYCPPIVGALVAIQEI